MGKDSIAGYPDDIIGLDDIIGDLDDDDLDDLLDELSGEDIVGATERGRLTRRAVVQKIKDRKAVVLQKRRRGPRRRKLLPGVLTNVGANATATINLETEEDFRPERLVVASANAASFSINSIKVGTEEQLVSAGSFPADAFEKDAVDTDIEFKTLNVGSKLSIVVQNNTAGALDFDFGFIGTAVD